MTMNVEIYDSNMKRVIPSPMSIIGLTANGLPLPFARDYLSGPPTMSTEAVRIRAIQLHAAFNEWCSEEFATEGRYSQVSYGSDPDGYYIPASWDEHRRFAYGLTIRLLAVYTTAAALGHGLKFSR
jgi:hypothetical protein